MLTYNRRRPTWEFWVGFKQLFLTIMLKFWLGQGGNTWIFLWLVLYFSFSVPEVGMEDSVWFEVLGFFCSAVTEHVAQSGVLLYLGLLRKSCFPCALSRESLLVCGCVRWRWEQCWGQRVLCADLPLSQPWLLGPAESNSWGRGWITSVRSGWGRWVV